MPDRAGRRRYRTARAALAAALVLLLTATAATAVPDWQLEALRGRLKTLTKALKSDEEVRGETIASLITGIGRPGLRSEVAPTAAYTAPVGPATLGWTDIRFALGELGQVYGREDHVDVIAAQPRHNTLAISADAGVVTLDQLRTRLTHRQIGVDAATGALTLHTPLIVGPDAVLRLAPGETLRLSRPDGAFIVVFGRLEVFGAEISGTETPNPRTDEFRPFVTALGTGTMLLSGGTFTHLGFGYSAKFSGVSVMAHFAMRPPDRTVIENNRFEDLVTVAVVGASNVEVRGNRFFDMLRNPLLISRARRALVAGNLFTGDSPTNAIRVANGSDGARLIGNTVLEGSRSGLLIASGSDNATVADNLIWRRNGGGVKLHNVACGQVADNLLLDDRQKGIEIRASLDAQLTGNAIIGNDNAGVWISAQPEGAVTYVTGNLMRENGTGLAAATGGEIALGNNDLSNQFPRFLGGDLTWQFRAIAGDLHGRHPILLDSGGWRPADRLRPEGCAS